MLKIMILVGRQTRQWTRFSTLITKSHSQIDYNNIQVGLYKREKFKKPEAAVFHHWWLTHNYCAVTRGQMLLQHHLAERVSKIKGG